MTNPSITGTGKQALSQKTAERFAEQMSTFVTKAKSETTPNEQGRTKFPGFEIMPVIRQKAEAANTSLKAGEMEEAFARLNDMRTHFQNQQAAWAKNLRQGIVEDYMTMAKDKCPEDLLSPVRTAVGAYEALLDNGYFDLDTASKLYWAAIDKLDCAEETWKRQIANKQRKERELQAKRTEAQKEAEMEIARQRKLQEEQRHRQTCAATADELSELIGSL